MLIFKGFQWLLKEPFFFNSTDGGGSDVTPEGGPDGDGSWRGIK